MTYKLKLEAITLNDTELKRLRQMALRQGYTIEGMATKILRKALTPRWADDRESDFR